MNQNAKRNPPECCSAPRILFISQKKIVLLALSRNESNNLEPPSPPPISPTHPSPFTQENRNQSTHTNHTANTNVRRQSLPDTRELPKHTEEAAVGKQGQMDELEEEKRKGREKRTDTFLSFLESTIPGTVWRMYVRVQINRRIARSRALKC